MPEPKHIMKLARKITADQIVELFETLTTGMPAEDMREALLKAVERMNRLVVRKALADARDAADARSIKACRAMDEQRMREQAEPDAPGD